MASWAAAWPQKMSAVIRKTSPAPAPPRRYMMPGVPEIYFHKAIDNSRLVRTQDPVRKREMNAFVAALSLCFLVVLFYMGEHLKAQQYGYDIERLRQERTELANVNRTLRLEEATLKSPQRISDLARQQGMALPSPGQVQRLEEGSGFSANAPVMARAGGISVVSVPN
jgi:cell division protein FtsL